MKVKLLISYDGTDFEGWQRQAGDKPTVQASVEIALSRLFNERITITGSGRTDSGVHAEGQVAHFMAPKDPRNMSLIRSLNALTPTSIAIHKAWLAPDDFHAQMSATKKTYRYVIYNNPIGAPHLRHFSTWLKKPLHIEKLQALTDVLVGTHDFKSFQTTGTNVATTTRTIFSAQWKITGESIVEFWITGEGFLKQMVRNIVGTSIYLHQNEGTPDRLLEILAAKDRQKAKDTAPPEGLFLHSVEYPAHLDNACVEL